MDLKGIEMKVVGRVVLIMLFVGVCLLGIFKSVYPEVPVRSAASIVTVTALVAALLIDALLKFIARKRETARHRENSDARESGDES